MKTYLFIAAFVFFFFYDSQSQPGMIDSSFGINGVVASNIGQFGSGNLKLVHQKDQKIVVSSNIALDSIAVHRYMPDGTPDSSFGINGKIESELGTASVISIQKDGKILVGGDMFKQEGEFPSFKIVFRRFFSNGTIDSSFGENGMVVSVIDGLQQTINDMILQEDGKILIVGSFSESGKRPDILLARYMPDGSLDSSFGNEQGKTRILGKTTGNTIALQKDGRIIIAGSDAIAFTDERFMLVRYTTTGMLDSSFGGTGIIKTDFDLEGEYINDILIQPDDKILALGIAFYNDGLSARIPYIALARYQKDGELDTEFGTVGKVKLKLPERSEGFGLGLQSNDKIVVSGYTSFVNSDYVLARYLSDGTPDLEFGENGVSVTDLGATDEKAGEMIIQPSGRIVVRCSPGTSLLGYEGDRPGIITKIRRWIRKNILNFTDENGTASYYIVEQQNSGGGFMPVARIASNQRNNYSYDISNHTSATANTNYRIKAVYADGAVAYSDAITTSALQADTKVSISPNPASSIINISLKENKLQDGTVFIYDAMGNLVRSQSYAKQSKIAVNISSLRQGHYRVVVNSNGVVAEGGFLKE